MFSIGIGDYHLQVQSQGLPSLVDEYARHAQLYEIFESNEDSAEWCFCSVARNGADWPFLVVVQRYSHAQTFNPAALIVTDSERLFIGAGERLLAYNLDVVKRVWEDSTEFGCLSWARYGEVILMSGELELAAWNTEGEKLWTTFVEPPWDYKVIDGKVQLEVMGKKSEFPLKNGPPAR